MRHQGAGSTSAAEIEREVKQSRAEVEQTLDAIQARLSPGELLDQAVDYFREGRGAEVARNLGDSIPRTRPRWPWSASAWPG